MPRINITIIERNITGCADSSEQEILHSWLQSDESNRNAYFRMKNIWDSCYAKGYSQDDIRKEWELLAKRLENVERPSTPNRRRFSLPHWARYAAIFVLGACITWGVISLLQSDNEAKLLPVAYQSFTVPNGQRIQVILSDGTKVWLNAGSTLQYPSDFGINNRRVILDGEASFEVIPAGTPFMVTAGKVEITVLGTHFNVRNYSSENFIETALFEGSVKMQLPKAHFILEPGQVATYRKTEQIAEVRQDPGIANKSAWSRNQLIINGERFEDMVRTLERWYNVQITIADDELKDYRYTGKFAYNEDIHQVMKIISATTAIRYVIKDDKINIWKR